jgi:hypothetical protein
MGVRKGKREKGENGERRTETETGEGGGERK